MLELLPPEIFARVLEIAIDTWGIGFLPPICLVSSTCYDVVVSTPSLWGIIVVDRQSSLSLLTQQLVKVKAADIRLSFCRKGWRNRITDKHSRRFMASLAALSHNWVRVDMPTNLLGLTRWLDMWRVEILSLRYHGGSKLNRRRHTPTRTCTPSRLRACQKNGPRASSARASPTSPSVVLSASPYRRSSATSLSSHTFHTLDLENISFLPLSAAAHRTVHLAMLTNLELVGVQDLTPLLLNLRAPALRTLRIRNCIGQMGSVLSQWSQAGYLPAHLQSLELSHCFSTASSSPDSESEYIPLLIGWLARLPALLRLTLSHHAEIADPISPDSSLDTDLFRALASPHGAGPIVGGWLCPSLIHLCLDTALRSVAEVLPIAQARARAPGGEGERRPATLQSLQAQLCSSGSDAELAELRSFFAEAEDVRLIQLSWAAVLNTFSFAWGKSVVLRNSRMIFFAISLKYPFRESSFAYAGKSSSAVCDPFVVVKLSSSLSTDRMFARFSFYCRRRRPGFGAAGKIEPAKEMHV
ncbi:hypothetical protein B0H14DRAFT_2570873 [Mycena olivaceomarginata]|nr:hypothetical protein B0H14DRAFT_2570873 [Mycena olivaceomarginata]